MQRLSEAIPAALVDVLRGAPLSSGKVAFAWRAAVGSAIQRVTAVRLERDTLLVDTSSAQWSREVHRLEPIILRRLGTLLGDGVVKRIETRTRQ